MRDVYHGRIVHLRLEDVELPNGAKITLEVVRHSGAAAIVAVDDERQVVLIRQFRHAAGGFIWEIPAGRLEKDEPPLDCAQRELEEETGLRADAWKRLGEVITAPGFCDERIQIFLATGLRETAQRLEPDEVLSVSRVPLRQALRMIESGEISDGKSVAGLHHAWIHFSGLPES